MLLNGLGLKKGAVYISAKSKIVSSPQIARIAVTSFKLHKSKLIIFQHRMLNVFRINIHTFTNHLEYF